MALRSRRLLVSLTLASLLGTGEAAGAQLTVSWTDNSDGKARTAVERRLFNNTAFTTVAELPPGVMDYIDTSVTAGGVYCYRARAHSDHGVSPYSNEACAFATDPVPSLSVTVGKVGNGAGTVTSVPAGVNCGSTCSMTLPSPTFVVLTATAASGSTFSGWSGSGCSGTASCVIAGNAPVTITATFTRVTPTLTVSPSAGPPGTEFTVSLAGWGGGASDWLAIAPVGAANTTYGASTYVSFLPGIGATRSWRVTLNTPGTFEARLFLSGGFTRAATSATLSVANVALTPVVSELSPANVTVGSAAFTLVVTGAKFAAGATATIGGKSRVTTFVSGSEVRVAVLAADVAALGAVPVQITNPGSCAGSCVSNTASLTVSATGPTLTVASTGGGTEFIVTLSNWSGGPFDWLAIAPAGVGNTAYGPWIYVSPLANAGGTRVWRVTLNARGVFEARLFLNNGYIRAATSPVFTVPAFGGGNAVVAP